MQGGPWLSFSLRNSFVEDRTALRGFNLTLVDRLLLYPRRVLSVPFSIRESLNVRAL